MPEHPELPAVEPKDPAGQSLQEEEPEEEYFPAAQSPEQADVCKPVVAPYLPP